MNAVLQELRGDGGDAGRTRVGTVHIGSAGIAVLLVVVVGAGDWIGILDLVGEGNGG
jgi:hypothetical protein